MKLRTGAAFQCTDPDTPLFTDHKEMVWALENVGAHSSTCCLPGQPMAKAVSETLAPAVQRNVSRCSMGEKALLWLIILNFLWATFLIRNLPRSFNMLLCTVTLQVPRAALKLGTRLFLKYLKGLRL